MASITEIERASAETGAMPEAPSDVIVPKLC